jgi:single-stranded DNA-binding protein
MNDINSYSVSGRLGQDAELIYFGDGTPSLKFRIASSRFLR